MGPERATFLFFRLTENLPKHFPFNGKPGQNDMSEEFVRKKRGLKEYIYLFFTGVCMGAADIVPGVSGGTLAFIMGIYEELIDAIKSVNVKLFQLVFKCKIKECFAHVPWQFLLVLAAGLLITVKLLADVIHGVLESPSGRIRLFGFFFGLVVASIITLGLRVKWRAKEVVGFVLGVVVAWLIVGITPAETPQTPVFVFVCGMIAICAMILPGISGSFLLLIMGQYGYIIGAIKDFNLKIIIIFGAGAAIGLMVFSRILSWMLLRFHSIMVAVLIGFMGGSLRKIWPFKDLDNTVWETKPDGEMVALVEPNIMPDFASPDFMASAGLAVLGVVVIVGIELLNKKMSGEELAA